MDKIKVMNTNLANKIAAGEVVERINSVIKELVENSIDAKSTDIKIELIESGIKKIKVIDNGIGMSKNDAMLAFERHATSKIISDEDLFHITTLGFRGEALPSIASVSKVSLTTSDSNEGTSIKIEAGIITDIKLSSLLQGTTIEVNNLFYNTPARLKHLKSLYAELAVIIDYISKTALANPHISFELKNDDQIMLKTDGKGNLHKTIKDIYNYEVASKVIQIKNNNNDYEIYGYISKPEITRSTKNSMTTIVNGRIIKNYELNKTINDAYHGFKPDNKYPIVILNIDCDPTLIDVNVHPTKMDIKFSKMEELKSLIIQTIQAGISNKNLIPNIKPKDSSSAPTIYKEQTLDFDFIQEKDENVKYMPTIYPIGLFHGTYILAQNNEGLYLIDQHAAKERINYEIYKEKLGQNDNSYIDMLIPLVIELSPKEYQIFKNKKDIFEKLGIVVEDFGLNSIIIKTRPSWLKTKDEQVDLRTIIEFVIEMEDAFNIERFKKKQLL
ncbi:MAG: DNA mismatch repair endonuclease MutL [Bacilli bacterium]|nr:DNA mismatch repair endonuclease MutL [Bacilli bacterium]